MKPNNFSKKENKKNLTTETVSLSPTYKETIDIYIQKGKVMKTKIRKPQKISTARRENKFKRQIPSCMSNHLKERDQIKLAVYLIFPCKKYETNENELPLIHHTQS